MASAKELKEHFLNLIKNKNLFHSYIFFGESNPAKFNFAKNLAYFLENKEWESSPKYIFIDSLAIEPNESENIGIDAVRAIKNFLWQKPIKSEKRTVIIDKAFDLTIEAQNSLLRITEAPPEHSLIILILDNPEVLSPPLLSRFQKIYFCFSSESGAPFRPENEQEVSAKKLAMEFLNAHPAKRSQIIKTALDNSNLLENFIKFLISELSRDPLKNWSVLKKLFHRWTLIKRYNVNKKLQLETIIN